jgi:predicted O-methyltransferase YrrM
VSAFFQAKAYLNYWLDAVDDHSLHSPFYFDLYRQVVRAKSNPQDFSHIEKLRDALKHNQQQIPRSNFGAGSTKIAEASPTVTAIAGTSLSSPKYLALYHRLIAWFNCKTVVELGTSLGIASLYLSQHPGTTVTTFEGSPEIAALARTTFESGNAQNITLHEGDIDKLLPKYLLTSPKLDFVFMDANHRYEPTIRYFNWILQKTHARTCVVMDDIHHSEEMERAWNEIRNNNLVYGTVDLFRCGIVFFDASLTKQHVVLQF